MGSQSGTPVIKRDVRDGLHVSEGLGSFLKGEKLGRGVVRFGVCQELKCNRSPYSERGAVEKRRIGGGKQLGARERGRRRGGLK